MHFAQTSAALHFCYLIEQWYEDQISIGVNAVDTSLLGACCAEQHRKVVTAFCPDQCCTAFLLYYCTPV